MKTFGVVLLIIGIITTIISYNMDVSITVVNGETIKDAGLAFDRQNYMIGSALLAVFGALIAIFGDRRKKK